MTSGKSRANDTDDGWILARFQLFRTYIEHEDELVNNRTTWLIQIQAFLLATFGLSYQKKLEIYGRLCEPSSLPSAPKPSPCLSHQGFDALIGSFGTEYNYFMLVLCIVGFFVALFSHISVSAAQSAVANLESQWRMHYLQAALRANLPMVTGGGHPDAPERGFKFPLYLPKFFLTLWGLTFFAIVAVNFAFR